VIVLNWRELAVLSSLLNVKFAGQYLKKVFVVKSDFSQKGYEKNDYAFAFDDKQALHLSLRANWAFLRSAPVKNFPQAALSGFLQSLKKHLEGKKLLQIEAIFQERFCRFFFEDGFSLLVGFIACAPQAYLYGPQQELLSCTKEGQTPFLGNNKNAPEGVFLVRKELSDLSEWSRFVENALQSGAFLFRKQALEKKLALRLKQLRLREEKIQRSFLILDQQPDTAKWAVFLELCEVQDKKKPLGCSFLLEPNSLEKIHVDPRLNFFQQQALFYEQAKRNKKKRSSLQEQLLECHQQQAFVVSQQAQLLGSQDVQELIPLEKIFDVAVVASVEHTRRFLSLDGFEILIGRDKEENLYLTFKVARSYDVWMHLRNRPSAHGLILMRNKKRSFSLDSLLDAAHLVLHYSRCAQPGKWEVDYTFQKNVRRIKKTDQVHYSQNKTLMVDFDQLRLDRLLSQF
jgi:predicted ribosome quality control (RQC) complex YloA/Tae2 family protein